MTRLLRALVPRGLLGRSLLIILLPLLILQAVALQIFYGSHLDVISRRLAAGVAGDIGMVVELVARGPAREDRGWIFRQAAWRLDLTMAFEEGATLGPPSQRGASLPLLPLEEDLDAALRERVRRPFDTDWQTDPRSVVIRVQLPDGVLHVEAPRKRLFASTLYLFLIWMVGSALILFLVAAVFMKNQVRAIRRLAMAAAVGRVVHATTLFTNALIERKGAVTALVTTEGFRDVLGIGRERRYELYDLDLVPPAPLVPRALRLEVPERVKADGTVLVPLDLAALEARTAEAVAAGAESLAILFLHADLHPAHEAAAVAHLAARFPRLAVTASHAIVREVREYDRGSTATANAYIAPLADRYLARLGAALTELGLGAPLLMMLSSGGLTHLAEARRAPVQLLESGPAAGALAAAFLAGTEERRVLAFDMGGTTAKLCVVEAGEPQVVFGFEAARQARFIEGMFDMFTGGALGRVSRSTAKTRRRDRPRRAAGRRRRSGAPAWWRGGDASPDAAPATPARRGRPPRPPGSGGPSASSRPARGCCGGR